MSNLALQSWRFAALVGCGFLLAAIIFQFYVRDEYPPVWILVLTAVGSSIILLSNRAITMGGSQASFLVLVGAGTLLFLLGGVVHWLAEYRSDELLE